MSDAETGAREEFAALPPLTRVLAERAGWRPQLVQAVISRTTPTPLLAYELSARGRQIVPIGWTEIVDNAPGGESARGESPHAFDDWKTDTQMIDRMRRVLEVSQSHDPAGVGTLRETMKLSDADASDLAQVIMNLPPPMAEAAVSSGVFSHHRPHPSAAPATEIASRSASIQRTMAGSADEPIALSERPSGAAPTAGDVTDHQALDQLANEVYGRLRWRLLGEAERLMR
jgi:hypothetical protein